MAGYLNHHPVLSECMAHYAAGMLSNGLNIGMDVHIQKTDFSRSYRASPDIVQDVIEQLISDLKYHGYAQPEIDEIVLSLDEAITNAIQVALALKQENHGTRESADSSDITIQYSMTDDAFDATVMDRGKGFNIFNILSTTPRIGSANDINQIISYASDSEQAKIRVRVNGEEIPLHGIGAGLKIILNFMDTVTIDFIGESREKVSRPESRNAGGTILHMRRQKRYL
jgi:anti-sigma regulatory factor (Ser/Thr protein kinase)